jgi:hypothetical protein
MGGAARAAPPYSAVLAKPVAARSNNQPRAHGVAVRVVRGRSCDPVPARPPSPAVAPLLPTFRLVLGETRKHATCASAGGLRMAPLPHDDGWGWVTGSPDCRHLRSGLLAAPIRGHRHAVSAAPGCRRPRAGGGRSSHDGFLRPTPAHVDAEAAVVQRARSSACRDVWDRVLPCSGGIDSEGGGRLMDTPACRDHLSAWHRCLDGAGAITVCRMSARRCLRARRRGCQRRGRSRHR